MTLKRSISIGAQPTTASIELFPKDNEAREKAELPTESSEASMGAASDPESPKRFCKILYQVDDETKECGGEIEKISTFIRTGLVRTVGRSVGYYDIYGRCKKCLVRTDW